ncbi:MBL fold metallo-hydrolase [Kineococcus rhizosphaerae]|uniref:L-ascorbate metabolism protein UlaG (Beta-lactamase superfamily) n=1 Tax=Kineococcus rhizosphaerae TaxID=559628 RepID=A0A2T0R1K8_9ACTN|nr:MBL fold metallo-hydrolase [Kineococcus rhizosphaerae]PRY13448.1 L-ascorbate metabolism protein UlaG (beta-lactamase superfamily) [Kineococcus rhizosphaerae]
MELTKHTHATVVLTKDGASLLIDPGAYTPNTPELLAAADAVLFTHDHPDHVDVDALRAELGRRPDLPVFGPASVTDAVPQVRTVGAGDSFDAAGFAVSVFGGQHAVIHADLPPMQNVAFLVDGDVYHPGDSYEVPGVEVRTLLVPTSGPWAKLGEGVDFVRAVKPQRAIAVHDLMLSETGRGSTSQFTGQLTGTPLEIVPVGSTVSL